MISNKITAAIVDEDVKLIKEISSIKVSSKDAQYVTGSKTHPDYFDAMTPDLISAMDRPLLK